MMDAIQQYKYNSWLTKDLIQTEYADLKSLAKIAHKYNIDTKTVAKYCKLYEIEYKIGGRFIYQCNDNLFKEQSKRAFYLAGFIAADGNIYRRGNCFRIKISLALKDLAHLEKIKDILQSNHPINKYKSFNRKTKQYYDCCELSIVSSLIANDLLNFNILPRKTFSLKFPEHLKSHPLINHYLRGYFDGDGGFYNMQLGEGRTVNQMGMYLRGTQHFLTHFVDILDKNTNINSPCERVKHYDSTYSFSYCGNNIVSKLSIFLYNNSNIFLTRKHDLVKHLINNTI